jgi:hypothetical protein
MSLLDGANGRKFIATGPFDDEMPYHYIVIADIQFWVDNEDEIYQWMEDNLPRGKAHHAGMMISLDSEIDRTAFCLRWA